MSPSRWLYEYMNKENGKDMFTCVEICAGAGGQALGLELAGFSHLALVEIERHYCSTLLINRPEWNVLNKMVSFLVLKSILLNVFKKLRQPWSFYPHWMSTTYLVHHCILAWNIIIYTRLVRICLLNFDIENSNLTTDWTNSLLDKYMEVFKIRIYKDAKAGNSIAKDKV